MTKFENKNAAGQNIVLIILISALMGIAAIIIIALIGALLVSRDIMPQQYMQIYAIAACILSSVFSGFRASCKIRKRRLVVGIATGFLMFAILFLIGIVLPNGDLEFANVLTTLLVILLASVVGSLLCGNTKRKR